MDSNSYVVIDTNILLRDACILEGFKKVIIPSSVLEELDGLKNSKEIGHLAREANRKIEEYKDKIKFELKDVYEDIPSGWDKDKRDNKIVLCARDHNAVLISNDINVRIKADSLDIECFGTDESLDCDDVYKGYDEITMTHEQQADFYKGEYEVDLDLILNQYLIMIDKETGDIVDKFKMTENGLINISYKNITSRHIGKIKPRNLQQTLMFDMLQDKDLTILACTGKFGVGKDFVMIAHALQMIEKGKYDKLIWVRNTIEVKDSKPVGFLKGSLDEKLLPYASILSDHLGGSLGLELLIKEGKIELQHLGFIRGRDLKNSIVYCSEAENLTKEHVQLLIGRIGEGSVLYLNGDYKQVDEKVFERNNGLNIVIKKLKGHKRFGYVKLEKTERSETADMADLLD